MQLALIRSLSLLPLSAGRALGQLIGTLASLLPIRITRNTRINLALCFPELPESERNTLARKSLQETAKLAFEMAKVWTHPPEWSVRQFVGAENRQVLDNAFASGKAVIVLAPHLGNWEILGPYIAHSHPLLVLYLPPENPDMEKLIVEGRVKGNLTLAPANRKGVQLLLKQAAEGKALAILPDQEPEPSGGEFAPFFHEPAFTMTLVHKIMQRHPSVVVMGYAKRVAGGFVAVFAEPDPAIYQPETAVALAAMNRSVEACIRQTPEQYQWEYKRFKQHPSGKKEFHYRKR